MDLPTIEVKERKKVLMFRTSVQWISDKIGTLSAEDKAPFTFSSPPEFKGTPELWTPEELFVGALEMCHMLTFMGFAEKRHLAVLSYLSEAEGTLEFVGGAYRFTNVTIRPTIYVGDPTEVVLIQKLAEDIHGRCLIANSVAATVEYRPKVFVR
jgi:organic hydroperoxide reductase OsmC/OhrA